MRWRRLLKVRSGCAHVVRTCTWWTVPKDTSPSLSPSSRTVTFTTPLCSTGKVWQSFGVTVEEGWRGREEDVEKLGIGGTNARRSRTGRQGKSHSRTLWSISRQVPALPVRYDCKVWPASVASVQLHAPPSPAECETGQSDSVVASCMSKIASECSSLCCCTRLVKRKNIRSGQASPGMERALSRAEREQGSPCIDSIREESHWCSPMQ